MRDHAKSVVIIEDKLRKKHGFKLLHSKNS